MKHVASSLVGMASATLLAACASIGSSGPDPSELVQLRGTNWKLESMLGEATLESAPVTLLVTMDGPVLGVTPRVEGTGGCNRYFCSFELDGDRLKIYRPLATRKSRRDPEGIMEQEQKYFGLLTEVTSFEILGKQLVLYSGDGDPLMKFSTD